jgi:hypothetical protein
MISSFSIAFSMDNLKPIFTELSKDTTPRGGQGKGQSRIAFNLNLLIQAGFRIE